MDFKINQGPKQYSNTLFNNNEILIEGQFVCYNKWIEKGVLSMHDGPHEASQEMIYLSEI